MRTLKFRFQSSISFFASVNHCRGPGQTTTYCVLFGGFPCTLSVSFFSIRQLSRLNHPRRPGADIEGARKPKRAKENADERKVRRRPPDQFKMSEQFWLLIGARNSGTNQKPDLLQLRRTALVTLCPQGLFSPLYNFLR